MLDLARIAARLLLSKGHRVQARDVIAECDGAKVSAKAAAAALREVSAKREARKARKLPVAVAVPCLLVPSPGDKLRRTLADTVRIGGCEGLVECFPALAGGPASVSVHVLAPRHLPAVHVGRVTSWKKYGSKSYLTATATGSVSITARLGVAVTRGLLPLASAGLIHVDAVPVDGGWRVLAATVPGKGSRKDQAALVWQFFAQRGREWAHGATLEECRETLSARVVASRMRGVSLRIRAIAARIVARGSAPVCLRRIAVTDADRAIAGQCRAGAEAWLVRAGMDAATLAVPLAIVARLGRGDQAGRVTAIVTACLGRVMRTAC